MNTTDFLNMVAGNVFGSKTSPALPTSYWLGLSTTAPAVAGTGASEPSGGSYARVQLSNTNLGDPTAGVVKNDVEITFPESTSSWGKITHYVIYDKKDAAGSKLLMYGALTQPRTVETGTTMRIKVGELSLSALNPAE